MHTYDYDYVIIGSGFGGSISAYRLAQKGYSVLVLERGKWYQADDFAKTNWNLKRWIWAPKFKLSGIMKVTLFRHVSVISGSGVGGGSLVYASTLPTPASQYYQHGSWKDLANWEDELRPFYDKAKKMLGRATNTKLGPNDEDFRQLAIELDIEEQFAPNPVGVFLGEPGKTVPDPYFNGDGPDRAGCIHCGECLTGCRHNAKNSLDKNYLYLAQKLGTAVQAEREVIDVKPLGADDGSDGYRITHQISTQFFQRDTQHINAKHVVFSGGVIGSIKLLLKLKQNGSLPKLSNMLGKSIRTNNEALILVTSTDESVDRSQGLAIGSILHLDENTHIEPNRYGPGSGAWRLFLLPQVQGSNVFRRVANLFLDYVKTPVLNLKVHFVKNWAKQSNIILFMQSVDSTLQFKLNRFGMMTSALEHGDAPSAFIPQALDVGQRLARIVKGKATSILTESLTGIPSTAHILGGAVMGDCPDTGVVDKYNRVYGYQNMMICDGSNMSANPGVNPSLSIAAITEHAMHHVPEK